MNTVSHYSLPPKSLLVIGNLRYHSELKDYLNVSVPLARLPTPEALHVKSKW